MSQKEFWNEKALNFPRYNKDNNNFQQKIIEALKNENILTEDTTVLDIGCGTGVYTIPLAQEVKRVLALDISSIMLEFLEEDSWNHNVNKTIETKCNNWQEFEIDEKFDLVFATLSAAFNSEDDFEKILNYSKKHVAFLDFVNTKGSNFEELLHNSFGVEKFIYKDLENKKRWLDKKGIKYKTIPLNNTVNELLEKDIAVSEIKKILNSSKKDIKLSDEEILILLKPLIVDKKVNFILNMKLELLFWENSK